MSATSRTSSKTCSICGIAEASISLPSISGSQQLCLLHYFTTGAHRATSTKRCAQKNNGSLLIDEEKINQQLPQVQDLFSEAFVQLQREIGEQSARVFQSAANADDPLAVLLDSNTPALPRRSNSAASRHNQFRKINYSNPCPKNLSLEGGFIHETPLPDKFKILQTPNLTLESNLRPSQEEQNSQFESNRQH